MKKITSKLLGGVLLFSLSMSLTSCEGALDDIFGHWERPRTPVASVELNETMIVVNVGATSMSLTGIVSPANATDKTITWKSSNPSVATVDANGLVSFVGQGSVIITATADGVESSCEVIVNNPVDLATKTADFEVQDCEALSGTLNVSTTPIKVTVADGATVTLENMTIEGVHGTAAEYKHAGLSFEGDGTLILKGVNIVKGFHDTFPGIHVKQGKTLTIKGDGKLTASSGESTYRYGSGIGGGSGIDCGNIVIESGTIIADGGRTAAGIGGGNGGACGDITIHGGDITATCEGYAGAGIGIAFTGATGGGITITGGKITAEVKGNNAGVAIGSAAQATMGKITISGGDITATGGRCGIGAYTRGKCGDIDISGGKIVATSGLYGAGIGTGYGNNTTHKTVCGNITISGGEIIATGGQYAAGIGTGHSSTSGTSVCGDITITDGVTQVTATKGADATNSIGNGDANGTCGTVTIAPGANVTQN